MIESLHLKNFRRFQNKKFDFNKNIVVLHGENAQGKSSILESIYILSNGKSPWASSDEYINVEQEKDPHVRIELVKDSKLYVYFRDNKQRLFKIDDRNVRSKTFFSNTAATIFTPEQKEILMKIIRIEIQYLK